MGVITPQVLDGYSVPLTAFYPTAPEVEVLRRLDNEQTISVMQGDQYSSYVAFIHYSDSSGNLMNGFLVFSKTQNARVTLKLGTDTTAICSYSYTYQNQTVYYRWVGWTPSAQQYETTGTAIINEYPDHDRNIKERAAWLGAFQAIDGFAVTYDLQHCTGNVANPDFIRADATSTTFLFTPSSGYSFNNSSAWVTGEGESGDTINFTFDAETGTLTVGIVTSNITVHVWAYGDPYNGVDGDGDIPGADDVPVPGLPGTTATNSGIVGLFNPTTQEMQALANYMWTNIPDTGATVEQALNEITQALKRSISNPLDYILGLNIIPSQGLTLGASQNIRFGFTNSGVSMRRLGSQYFVVNCGSLSFNAICGDTFLDYAPYSKFSIYLPYIGVKDVDANDFVGHTIQVIYHGDVVTGGITAYILKDNSVMYQYAGCCALSIPLSADGWGSTISGAVQIATSIVAGAVTGGAAGAALGALKGASNVASNPSQLSPQVLRSGAVSGGAGLMGVQYPFIIREAVRFHKTDNFNTVAGYPSYYYKSLDKMRGFTSCFEVHLHNIPGTREEVDEIERLLKEGVIL